MRRFFINSSDIHGSQILISGPEARHLRLVLRINPGQLVELFDDKGKVYQAEITNVEKTVKARIISALQAIDAPPFLTLGLCLLKPKKMDLVIQKATELGVTSIYPLISQNCAVTQPTNNQQARWQRIIHESCKQCGRPIPLALHTSQSFPNFIEYNKTFDKKIILWEDEEVNSLQHLTKAGRPKSLLLIIGPEGGFQQGEIQLAIKHNCISSTLGKRILRAETAAISAISISQFLLDNLSRS